MSCSSARIHVPLILVLQTFTPLLAQSGTITGRAYESTSRLGLTGVNVFLRNTVHATTTAADGSFTLQEIAPGHYTVTFSAVGFRPVDREISLELDRDAVVNAFLEQTTIDLATVVVEGERSYSAASSRKIRQFDMLIRPARSAQELLQLAPGLVLAQHAGGGKAEQIFLRGFDADHGTDVAIYADGIPVNMVSHGHGQGYADLHFLIPETVEIMEVYKGPYFSRFGNLSTAGSVELTTKEHITSNLVKVEGGAFQTGRVTTILRIPAGDDHQSAYFAGQFSGSNGPFDSPQHFRRFNVFGKFHAHPGAGETVSLSAGAFSSGWDASGQIPGRAVASGMIGRFGSIDDREGGTTSRQNALVSYTAGSPASTRLNLRGYLSRYSFTLFSDFTFFLDDSINGDMIEQTDERVLSGVQGEFTMQGTVGSLVSTMTAGAGFRSDAIHVGLWKSPRRIREAVRVDAEIDEQNFFLWIDEQLVITRHWRLQIGARADYFTFNVNDRLTLADPATTDLPHASGFDQATIVSPKLNIVFTPSRVAEVYFNTGTGFHSNDSRDVIFAKTMNEISRNLSHNGLNQEQIDQELLARNFDPSQRDVSTLPRAYGAEVGLRVRPSDPLILSLAAWFIQLDEELVYVGDEGATEVSGRTRRTGLDAELRWQPGHWFWIDADLSLARGRFSDEPVGSDLIPLAPTVALSGGATAIHPSGIEGSLRMRHVGPRPANESGSVTALGHTVISASMGYRFGGMRIYIMAENLFDAEWNEAQFDTESRLKGEPAPVSEIHFTPGVPRNIQAGLSVEF